MDEWLSRTRLLFGDEPIKRLQNAHVLVVGVGGVGAYAAEMVVRAGIGVLTIIDGDTVSESNLNRQLVALHSTLGKPKVEVLKERFLDINPDLKLTAQHRFIEEEDIPALLEGGEIDFVIDAIDTLAPKVALIAYCLRHRFIDGCRRTQRPVGHTDSRHSRYLPLRFGKSGKIAIAERGYLQRSENGILHRAGRS